MRTFEEKPARPRNGVHPVAAPTIDVAERTSAAVSAVSAVSIEYCVPGNYERVARRLAQAIWAEFGESVELLPSRDGAFEVRVGGRLVFSKRATWRFPAEDEIFYHVANRPQGR
jgi:selenoprotein W-related protein